jgi:hypothetical protein
MIDVEPTLARTCMDAGLVKGEGFAVMHTRAANT